MSSQGISTKSRFDLEIKSGDLRHKVTKPKKYFSFFYYLFRLLSLIHQMLIEHYTDESMCISKQLLSSL